MMPWVLSRNHSSHSSLLTHIRAYAIVESIITILGRCLFLAQILHRPSERNSVNRHVNFFKYRRRKATITCDDNILRVATEHDATDSVQHICERNGRADKRSSSD